MLTKNVKGNEMWSMCQSQKIFLSMIFFVIWEIFLYYRTYDKRTKKYILAIGICLIFWMFVRILKGILSFENEEIYNIFWYMYYIPLILIPSFYYLASEQICAKWNISKSIAILSISTIFILIVLTNNIHKLVFSLPDSNGDYVHRTVYYLIAAWIFSLFIVSTVKLALKRCEIKKDYKVIIPFIPILLAFLYTMGYVKDISIFRQTNMSLINGFLVFFGIECLLDLKLIPNNIRYENILKKSDLKMSIISNDGKEKYSTRYNMKLPKCIKEDLKKDSIKKSYTIGNCTYRVEKITGGYSIIENDYSELINLKKKQKIRSEELKKQKEFLLKSKKVSEELYGIELKNTVLHSLENSVEEKKIIIENKLKNLKEDDEEGIKKIKLYIGYAKRVSSLVIDNYNNETYTDEKMKIILNELLDDLAMYNVKGALVISKMSIKVATMYNIYNILFDLIENLRDTTFTIYLYESGNRIEMKLILDKSYNQITEKLKNSKEVVSFGEKQTEDGTNISVTINS